jgi:biotin operon repressor
MQISLEVLDKGLTPREFYLLATMARLVNKSGEVEITMEELTELTGSSRTTLWRDMTALESHGLVDTVRSKRNLGRLYKNRYKLLFLCFSPETSTAGTSSTSEYADSISTVSKVNKVTTKALSTSYLMGGTAPEEEKMVNKWQDDDDDIAGVGLFLDEAPASQKQVTISKRDPKTRRLRPQEEWTAADVASEFAFRIYDRVRGIPGLINTAALRGLLSANRKKFGVTAVIEMEVMDKFFADERNLALIKRMPKNSHGIFANAITTNLSEVTSKYEMDEPLDTEEKLDYISASDGRQFDNSMPGRKALERYEEKLRRAN